MRDIWTNLMQLDFEEWLILMVCAPLVVGFWVIVAIMVISFAVFVGG